MSDEKQEYVVNYIRALKAVEDEMEPFKDHKRDLKANYIENQWLTKEEISMAVKAYRLMKTEVDFDELMEYYDKLKGI
jgi:hypothetical protein